MSMPSKLRRLISYAATAVLAILLYNAWIKEHLQPVPSALDSQSLSSSPSHFIPNTFSDHSVNPPSEKPDVPSYSGKNVSVKTDLLDVTISLLDGNVISAALRDYPISSKSSEPIRILNNAYNNNQSIYYAQSGFTNIENLRYDSDKAIYILSPNSDFISVQLKGKTKNGLLLTKTFIFKRNSYSISVNYVLKNEGEKTWSGSLFNQLVRQKPDNKENSFFYNSVYDGGSLSNKNSIYRKLSYKDMSKKDLSEISAGGWVAMQQHYFLSAWIPQNQEQKNAFYSNMSDDIYTLGFSSPEISVAPNEEVKTSATLYVGPEIAKKLKDLAPGLDRTVDYGWLWWISITIFWLMEIIHGMLGNWGWSIVLTTIVIKSVLYPLSAASFRSMARMRELQPKMQQLKERFADDRHAMSRATMELYRKEKINPLGGCLPMFIQIPIFIGLYYVIIESVQLRQAPFIFWINDLSVKDPYYVLPILMGFSMLIQQKLTPSSLDPLQAKVMMFIPVVFTFFFFAFPSGLTLYWFINNCMQIGQQYFVTKVSKKHRNN